MTQTAKTQTAMVDTHAMLVDAGLTASQHMAYVAEYMTMRTVTARKAQRSYPVWTARCKSGYQFTGKDGKYHTCNRSASRGELLCSECASAQVVATERAVSLLARAMASLRTLRLNAPRYANV
jgi:hypothetical protein